MRPLPRIPAAGEKITTAIFRDIINYLRAITPKAGAGVRVSQGPNGTTIDSTATGTKKAYGSADDLLPFTLRYHRTEGDQAGQLEVYLPKGSMTTEDDCVPLNVPARKKTGHGAAEGEEADAAEADWYAVDSVSLQSGSWCKIVAYVMPGLHMIVAQEAGTETIYQRAAIVRYVLAEFVPRTDDATGALVVSIGKQVNTGAKHTTETAVYAHGTNNLKWTLKRNADGAWEIDKLELVDAAFDAGGLMLEASDKVIPAGTSKVYLKVTHASQEYGLSVETDPASAVNDADTTWRLLFDVRERYPVVDYRFTLNTMLYLR